MEEEYLEIDTSKIKEESRIYIKVATLEGYKDLENVMNEIRAGKVLVLRIGEIKRKKEAELKKFIDKIKKFIENLEGDIIGVGDDLLILTPRSAKIER